MIETIPQSQLNPDCEKIIRFCLLVSSLVSLILLFVAFTPTVGDKFELKLVIMDRIGLHGKKCERSLQESSRPTMQT